MYIEFVILDNFALTFIAGQCAARLCHKRLNVFRLLAASAIGTVAAVFYPFLTVSLWVQIAIKVALGVVLCLIMFVKTPRALCSSLLFFGCTFALGGSCYALCLIFGMSAASAEEFCSRMPLALVLSVGVAAYFCVIYIHSRVRLMRIKEPYMCKARITVLGQRLNFSAYIDSGNCVCDRRNGMPIMITGLERFVNKLDRTSGMAFLAGVDRFPRMTINTAGGKAIIYILRPSNVQVYSDRHNHTIFNAELGLCVTEFSGEYELIIPAMAEGA